MTSADRCHDTAAPRSKEGHNRRAMCMGELRRRGRRIGAAAASERQRSDVRRTVSRTNTMSRRIDNALSNMFHWR